nr:translocation/assembly module TamB [Gammaproteobacteria bacterium]
PHVLLKTQANLNAEIAGDGHKVTGGMAKLNLTHGAVQVHYAGNVWRTNFNGGTLDISLTNPGLKINSLLKLAGKDHASAEVYLPNYKAYKPLDMQQPLQGKFNFNLHNLAKYIANIPYAKINSAGFLHSQLELSGSLAEPEFNGSGKLENTNINIPVLNIALKNIQIKAQAKHQKITLNAKAYSANKPIKVNANIDLKNTQDPIKVHLSGQQILVANSSEFMIHASPDLTAQYEKNQLKITGKIDIDNSKIMPTDFGSVTLVPESDMIYIRKRQIIAGQKSYQLLANIQAHIGKNVAFDAYGLKTNLTGDVNVISNDKGTLGKGRINITNGTYNIFDQVLKIDPQSSISFMDTPIDNPILNIKAYKNIQAVSTGIFQQVMSGNIIVGVQVSGNLNKPIISFYSNPAIFSQTQILSYLLFGYAGSTNTAGNVSLLLGVVNSLRLGHGKRSQTGAISKLRNSFGFTEFGVSSEKTLDAIGNPIDSQTSFVIGKYIFKWLYARYSVGLVSSINQRIDILQLQAILGKHWILQGTINTDFSNSTSANLTTLGNGVDLFYSTTSKH